MKNETRIELLKATTMASIESIVAVSYPPLMPLLLASKYMYGAGMQLRIKKVAEWVEMVQDNPDIFTEEILQTETFQDGFVYALEQYIRERSEEKRSYYQKIFCNFAKTEDKKNFEIERFYNSLTVLNLKGFEAIKRVDIQSDLPYMLYEDKENIDGVYNLLQAGIVALDTVSRWASERYSPPFVYTTEYGKEFIEYLRYEK